MKKICILFLSLFIIILTAIGSAAGEIGGQSGGTSDYLRLHIRANSNEGTDQAVKYLVRDEVVNALTPLVASCGSKTAAMRAVGENLSLLQTICEETLRANGFDYGAKAEIRAEEFPTRMYEAYTLEAGVYDALIIELGAGAGDNWWCCIYPPFCFTDGDVTYRSKILQIIEDFLGK